MISAQELQQQRWKWKGAVTEGQIKEDVDVGAQVRNDDEEESKDTDKDEEEDQEVDSQHDTALQALSALSTLTSGLLRCKESLRKHEVVGDLPDTVLEATREDAWREAALVEECSSHLDAKGASRFAQAALGLFQSLVDHTDTLRSARERDREDMHEAIKAMKKWRAREEIQRGRLATAQAALAEEAKGASVLEERNAALERELQLARSELSHLRRMAASTGLVSSLCATAPVGHLLDRMDEKKSVAGHEEQGLGDHRPLGEVADFGDEGEGGEQWHGEDDDEEEEEDDLRGCKSPVDEAVSVRMQRIRRAMDSCLF